jgi:hypothetical protein
MKEDNKIVDGVVQQQQTSAGHSMFKREKHAKKEREKERTQHILGQMKHEKYSKDLNKH